MDLTTGETSIATIRPADHHLIEYATAIAKEAHDGVNRKGLDEPYFNHPYRVFQKAQACGLSLDAQCAALLHDVVEDTSTTLEALAAPLNTFGTRFPDRVIHLVKLLTKGWPDEQNSLPEIMQRDMPLYYKGILSEPDAVCLKLIDRSDNFRDMTKAIKTDLNWAQSYRIKSIAWMQVLVDACPNAQVVADYQLAHLSLENAILTEVWERLGKVGKWLEASITVGQDQPLTPKYLDEVRQKALHQIERLPTPLTTEQIRRMITIDATEKAELIRRIES